MFEKPTIVLVLILAVLLIPYGAGVLYALRVSWRHFPQLREGDELEFIERLDEEQNE